MITANVKQFENFYLQVLNKFTQKYFKVKMCTVCVFKSKL